MSRPGASRARKVGVISVFALVGGLLTGCVDDSAMSTEQETDEATILADIDELMAQPSAEDARSGFEELSVELRDALDERFGSTGWVVESRFSRGTVCGGTYDVLDGRSVYVTAFAEDQALDHEDWAEAVAVISAVAADHGFDDPLMLAEGPGLHQLEIFGDRGSVIRFGSEVSLGVTVSSGCYLTDDRRAAIEEFGVPDPDHWRLLYPDSTAIPTEP